MGSKHLCTEYRKAVLAYTILLLPREYSSSTLVIHTSMTSHTNNWKLFRDLLWNYIYKNIRGIYIRLGLVKLSLVQKLTLYKVSFLCWVSYYNLSPSQSLVCRQSHANSASCPLPLLSILYHITWMILPIDSMH